MPGLCTPPSSMPQSLRGVVGHGLHHGGLPGNCQGCRGCRKSKGWRPPEVDRAAWAAAACIMGGAEAGWCWVRVLWGQGACRWGEAWCRAQAPSASRQRVAPCMALLTLLTFGTLVLALLSRH